MSALRAPILTAVAFCSLVAGQEKPMTAATAITRKDLLQAELAPQRPITNVKIQEVTIGPRQKAPLHLHPCPVVGVVTAGCIAFQIEGEAVQLLKVGDAFYEPADRRVARFDNDGDAPAKFTVFYLLGKNEHELIRLLTN